MGMRLSSGGRGSASDRCSKPLWADVIAKTTPNVKTTTQNLADLVAFTRALQWARNYGIAQRRPVLVRYDSEYAARIATGAWKARKHKAMAEEAQRAWAALKRANGGRVWMKHAPSQEAGSGVARRLAERDKAGARINPE